MLRHWWSYKPLVQVGRHEFCFEDCQDLRLMFQERSVVTDGARQ
jgi:hypothetical protein